MRVNRLEHKLVPPMAEVFSKVDRGGDLTPPEVRLLLSLQTPEALAELFAAARRVRRRHFGRRVFLYGFLYGSTHCRNHCAFCLYRHGNPEAPRYRKGREEMVSLALRLAESGVHLIDVTMGEDPDLYKAGGDGFEDLHHTLDEVMTATGLPVMASVGAVPPAALKRFAEQGVSWHACYQETHSPSLFARLRMGQDFESRMRSKLKARALGLLIEEGLLVGVGETQADILHSLETMHRLGADQVRVMTFVPQKGTPMATFPSPDPWLELKLIAIMRLCMPDRLIPASLDIDGVAGLRRRLDAGANVVTSLVPAGEGLAGVAQQELDIDAGGRSVGGIQEVIAASGLHPATPEEYRRWVQLRRQGAKRMRHDQRTRPTAAA